MRHFCLIFFINLLNKPIALIVKILDHGFVEKIGTNGKIWTKKIQALDMACIGLMNKI